MLDRFHGTILNPSKPNIMKRGLETLNNHFKKGEGFWDNLNVRLDDEETIENWQFELTPQDTFSISKIDVWRNTEEGAEQGAILFSKAVSPLEAMLWATVIVARQTEETDNATMYSERVLAVYQNPDELLPREKEVLTYDEWKAGV